jgi:single-strand DNA-binding protein
MASYNKVILIGNLTRDPDLRYTPSGSAVCEIGLAINRRFVVNGQDREETCFVDVTIWGKSAENSKRFLEKGSPVMIDGRLQLDQWEDREGGGKRSKLRVVAETVQFLGARREGDSSGAPPRSREQGEAPSRGSYEPKPYQGRQAAAGGRPQYGEEPPPMPDAAFNPGTEAEEDIPF